MRSVFVLVSLGFVFWGTSAMAQVLEKTVSFNYPDASLATVLTGIRKQYGVSFSYGNQRIPLDARVRLQVREVSLSQALDVLFQNQPVKYTLVGQQVVLMSAPLKKNAGKDQKKAIKRPVVPLVRPITDRPVAGESFASLLPVPLLETASSGNLMEKREILEASYSEEKQSLLKNFMSQLEAALEIRDSGMVRQLKSEFRRLKNELRDQFFKARSGLESPPDSTVLPLDSNRKKRYSAVQFSVVPPLSTNGKENRNTINGASVNLFYGRSGGVSGAEAGMMFNQVEGDVTGTQAAGLCNIVQGNLHGVQAAGLLNLATGEAQGVQAAGFWNLAGGGSVRLVQAAGFGNLHQGDLTGFQAAGFLNLNGGSVSGPQMAGFLNVTRGSLLGFQGAGFLNVAQGNVAGMQLAGFMNIASGTVHGMQAAGFLNLARNVDGVQLSGFLNQSNIVKGSQIGVINLADSVTGIQFGLINISRKGYQRLDFSYGEPLTAQARLRMGVRKFHTLIGFAIRPQETNPTLAYSLGFGSEKQLFRHLDLNLDLVCNQILEGPKVWTENLNLLNQAKVLLALRPGKRTAFFGGPVLNVAVSRVRNTETGAIGSPLIPSKTFFNELDGKTRTSIWLGWEVGIRF